MKRDEARKAVNSQGRLAGVDWSNAQKTINRKTTLLEKIVSIDRRKKELAASREKDDDITADDTVANLQEE